MNASVGNGVRLIILGGLLGSSVLAQDAPERPMPRAVAPGAEHLSTPAAPAKAAWKLLPGLQLYPKALDVSADRKLAAFWGEQKIDGKSTRTVWLVDLASGQVADLLAKAGRQAASELAGPRAAVFSADGRHLAVSSDTKAGIIDPRTGRAVIISGARPRAGMAWSGGRLLLDSWDKDTRIFGPIAAYDLAGKRVKQLPLYGWLLGGSRDGERLLMRTSKTDPGKPANWAGSAVAVVTPEGKILHEVAPGGNICDKEAPVLSRLGNYVGAYCANSPKGSRWVRRIDSVDGRETIFFPTGWGGTPAISETGGCVSFVRVSRERAVLCFWTRHGKRHELAANPMAATILDKEIFFIQGDSTMTTLRAVAVPSSGPGAASQPVVSDHDDP